MVACDKLLITHLAALKRKYAAQTDTVVASLEALVAADGKRGLSTKVVYLDNASTARSLRVPRVPEGDWAAAVRAVDRAVEKFGPSYVALVGATDVVPQARVTNPLSGIGDDTDPFVPSDLPYACDLPSSWGGSADLPIAQLLSVTRVVGRIPDVVNADDPAVLLAALNTATTYTQHSASTYQQVFSLTAAAWKGSTRLSVDLLPGPAPTTKLSPPARSPWTRTTLKARSHFVNCHGGDFTPDWFGQRDSNAPVDTVALSPEDVARRITRGTVVVAECCYGAMHQDPLQMDGRLPMLWAYLSSGAYAGVGSSTTAYGPADGNGQADLMCRFVLEGVLSGASTGRALLDARQRYVREVGAMGPDDLKTLAQFDLLGDPSLQPVRTPSATTQAKGMVAQRGGRMAGLAQRRAVTRATGRALAQSVPRASARSRRGRVDAGTLAQEAGLRRSAVVGEAVTFTEASGAPRAGYLFHVAPVRSAGRSGLVVSRETEGQRQTTSVWRK